MEDLAYMGVDFRTDFSKPFEAPYVPSVAKYTDNYILLMSASKIFSYAGQRIALVGMSRKVAERKYQALKNFFGIEGFIDAYVFGVLYAASSGTSHSAQYAPLKRARGCGGRPTRLRGRLARIRLSVAA